MFLGTYTNIVCIPLEYIQYRIYTYRYKNIAKTHKILLLYNTTVFNNNLDNNK